MPRATLRVNGTGCRAAALPKVRTGFEGAQRFREVRILENPGDSFEDAHHFPRCARKLRIFVEWGAECVQPLRISWPRDERLRFRDATYTCGDDECVC